jgi:hypothetical protein
MSVPRFRHNQSPFFSFPLDALRHDLHSETWHWQQYHSTSANLLDVPSSSVGQADNEAAVISAEEGQVLDAKRITRRLTTHSTGGLGRNKSQGRLSSQLAADNLFPASSGVNNASQIQISRRVIHRQAGDAGRRTV